MRLTFSLQQKVSRKKYIGVVVFYFLCQLILINYISPLLDENYLSEYWSDGIQYVISVIIYLCFCLLFALSLIVLQIYFLRIWVFRLNDIGFNQYLCIFPFFYFLVLLINNFFIFSPWVAYPYFLLIFVSAIPSTGRFKKTK